MMSEEGNKAIEESATMNRRSFLMGMGAMGAMGLAASFMAGCSPSGTAGATDMATTGTASEAAPVQPGAGPSVVYGGTSLTLAEINQRRREVVEAAGDYICADGTVYPAIWHKVYALTDSYGVGAEPAETHLDTLKWLMNDDENLAQAYLEMPYGVVFDALDFAEESGRTLEECQEICEYLATRTLLWRSTRAGTPVYHHAAYAFGSSEWRTLAYNWDAEARKHMPDFDAMAYVDKLSQGGSSLLYAMPADVAVVDAESEVLAADDWRNVIAVNETIAVSPCQCRMATLRGQDPVVGEELKNYKMEATGNPLECCFSFGEEAEFYISRGWGRQISKEEATELMEREVYEYGQILQSARTTKHEIICCCNAQECGLIGLNMAMGEEGYMNSTIYEARGRHRLEHDRDVCIKCGTCAERCPMGAITMDEEDGYPTINGFCVGCGQCGIPCPTEARKLVAKPEDVRMPLAIDNMEDYNTKAGFRIENGTL